MNNTGDCEFWPDEPSKCHTIKIILQVSSSLSLFGCLFVIATICLFKLYHYFVQRLILFLCICAGIDSLNLLIGSALLAKTVHIGCHIQAFIMQFFDFAQLLWICSIAVNIIMSIHQSNMSRKEGWVHFFVWFISLVMTLIPLIWLNYGKAGFWCWISREATITRFGTWYIPVLLVIVLLFIAYIYVIVKVYTSLNINEGSDFEVRKRYDLMLSEVKPLIAYPIIYFCLNLPMLITRIDDAVHPGSPPYFPLAVAGVICAPALGALNAIAFALYGETLKLLTWNHIKGAFYSFRHDAVGRVTHNYLIVDDGQNTPLISSDEEKMEYGTSSV